MFVDARELPDATRIEADVCIIGAGAAGITIARELARSRLRVCMLESGGFTPDPATQALYEGENVGLPYYELDELRLRYFGGTTNHWSGISRPLEELDFQARHWIPDSGWPFARSHLEPYYRRAHAVCELGDYDYSLAALERPGATRMPLDPVRVESAIYRRSPPTRFGQTYRQTVADAPNVTTYLNANVVELVSVESSRALSHVRAATLSGVSFTVHAARFVLATGAIENARLLLASNRRQPAGLGNEHDVVGRFFMEHVGVPGALLLPATPTSVSAIYRADGPLRAGTNSGKAFLTLPPAVLEREGLLNMRALIHPAFGLEALRGSSAAVESVFRLMRGLTGDFAATHASNIMRNPDEVLIYAYRRLFRPPRMEAYWLYNHVEQPPNRDSRVLLGHDRDALGLPRVRLDWRVTALEHATVRRAARLMAEEIGRAGIGRVRTIAQDVETGWPTIHRGLRGAWHQMGTTRMHRNPRHGVVDERCQVHGVGNLYIAGSSVFPTSGYTNPTLTIVALAIRLADELKGNHT